MTTRKEFVLGVPLAAAALPAIVSAAPSASANGDDQFDEARFAALVARRVTYRHLFAAKRANGGSVLSAIRNTFEGWKSLQGVQPAQINAVAVLYGGDAVMLGLNDAVWNQLLWPSSLAAHQQPLFESARPPGPGHGNPFYQSTVSTGDLSVAGLSGMGVTFLLCNEHLRELASQIAPRVKRGVGDVYARLVRGAVSGGFVVPSGVWAIHALQEKRFTYLQVNE